MSSVEIGLVDKEQYPQQLKSLPGGAAGTRRTLKYMREFVDQAKIMPEVRRLAHSIVGNVTEKDAIAEIDAVRRWVKKNIRYTFDIAGIETLQRPDATIAMGHGDCDDQAALVAALVESIGYPARFVAIGSGSDYEHVYAEVYAPEYGWIAAETTEDVDLGWEPFYTIRMVV